MLGSQHQIGSNWTLDVTQPDSTTNKKLQKMGAPPLLIDLIDQKLAVSRMIRHMAGCAPHLLPKVARSASRAWNLEELGTQTVNIGDLTMLHSPYNVGPPK